MTHQWLLNKLAFYNWFLLFQTHEFYAVISPVGEKKSGKNGSLKISWTFSLSFFYLHFLSLSICTPTSAAVVKKGARSFSLLWRRREWEKERASFKRRAMGSGRQAASWLCDSRLIFSVSFVYLCVISGQLLICLHGQKKCNWLRHWGRGGAFIYLRHLRVKRSIKSKLSGPTTFFTDSQSQAKK